MEENKSIKIMEKNNLRIEVCEYTNRPVVQERFGKEWICIHEDTREQELENIKQVTELLKN